MSIVFEQKNTITYETVQTHIYLEILASTISSIQACRTFELTKLAPDTRDEDRNIIGSDPVELRHYKYDTGLIPSARYEELLRLISIDHHQSLIIYHQLIQGKF